MDQALNQGTPHIRPLPIIDSPFLLPNYPPLYEPEEVNLNYQNGGINKRSKAGFLEEFEISENPNNSHHIPIIPIREEGEKLYECETPEPSPSQEPSDFHVTLKLGHKIKILSKDKEDRGDLKADKIKATPKENEKIKNNSPKINLSNQMPIPKNTRKIGLLTIEERQQKLLKYKEKKKRRKWGKKISYDCRKEMAEKRLRIKGRFVTKEQAIKILGSHADEISKNEILQNLIINKEKCSLIPSDKSLKIHNAGMLFTAEKPIFQVKNNEQIETKDTDSGQNLKSPEISKENIMKENSGVIIKEIPFITCPLFIIKREFNKDKGKIKHEKHHIEINPKIKNISK